MPIAGMINSKLRNTIAIAGLLFTEFLVVVLARDIYLNGLHMYTLGASSPEITTPAKFIFPVRIILEVDSMNIFMALISSTIALIAAIYSMASMKKETGQDKFYFLTLLLVSGMLGMEMTGDIFNMFVFLEIASISGGALVAFRTRYADSPEGGLKYIVVSAIAGLMVLFAIGLLYSQYDLLNIAALANAIQYTTLDKIALALLAMAFLMKLGSVPMHMWLPDAYSVAPTAITVILLANSQASMYALFRTCFSLFGLTMNVNTLGWMLIILGVLSMFIGVTMAVLQRDIKRLIAYNCICESGFMLLGVGVGLAVLDNPTALATYGFQAMTGGIFHMVNHALFEGLLFLAAGVIFHRIGTRNLNEMGGLGHGLKFTAVLFLLGAFASSGLPPLNGFASKILIYESVYHFNPVLAIIAVIVSIITLAIFVKVFFSAFTGQMLPKFKEIKEAPKPMMISMTILSGIIILFGLFPGIVVDWLAHPAVNALINQASYINAIIGGR